MKVGSVDLPSNSGVHTGRLSAPKIHLQQNIYLANRLQEEVFRQTKNSADDRGLSVHVGKSL